MRDISDSQTFESFARVAEAFGPYFFSILFVSLSVVAYKWYTTAVNRRPSNPQLASTCRLWFIFMGACLFLTAAISIWHWVLSRQPQIYTYQLTIADIPYDTYLNSEFHQRMIVRELITGNSQIEAQKRTYSFLIVQQFPFKPGQKFIITLTSPPVVLGGANSPGGLGKPREVDLVVSYSDPPVHTYRLKYSNANASLLIADNSQPTFDSQETRDTRELASVGSAADKFWRSK